jgi:L-threonylcarbamoyladenylate synthase
MLRLRIDPKRPEEAALDEAARVVAAGGIVAVPTDTLYGLAVDPFSAAAVARVFEAKGRQAGQGLLLVAADLEQVVAHFGELPPCGVYLASTCWPGPLTLVIPRPAALPRETTGGRESVGVRVPAHAVARALCRVSNRPLTATSANLSGQPAPAEPDEVARVLGSRIDLLLDAGRTPGGPPSTIVDLTGTEPRLVRSGAVAWERVSMCARR